MGDYSHRGSRPSGPFSQPGDRRIMELDTDLRAVEAISGAYPLLGTARDSTRSVRHKRAALDFHNGFSRGVVVHALPHVNWFKVQVGDGGGWVAACHGTTGGNVPIGPRDLAMPRPNDSVLLFKPQGLNFAYIIAVLPPTLANGSVSCPDWLTQGSTSGLKREKAHRFPITSMFRQGGVLDWSANRPQDQTSMEKGWIAATGLAMTIDDYMIQVRVHEMCGLWMTLADGWLRVAGMQTLIESSVHEEDAGDDEGESRYFRGIATYPWEAIGLIDPGTEFVEETDDNVVQDKGERAKLDLVDEDMQPIYRSQEFGGYLGQGSMRAVIAPAADDSVRKFRTSDKPDTGLFRENIGLDGSYTLLSAKTLHIGRRMKIVVPKQKEPYQSKQGDDAERGGYKASSQFGNGTEHKVGDVAVTDEPRHMLRVAGALDLTAYDVNWKAIHPFHYHTGDYRTWQESQLPGLVQDNLKYTDEYLMPDPTPRKVKIDHRYGEVEFFDRESFIRFHDDGTIHLAAGGGEELVMGGGRIRMSCPLGIELLPGTDLVAWAEQIILRAKGSVDVSSSEANVHVKAEQHVQVLAGNGGKGSIVLESRGDGDVHQYRNKFGEEVSGSGIVFKAPQSGVTTLAKDVYVRTGGPGLGAGDILLDAGKGERRCQIAAKEFHAYLTTGASLSFGASGEESDVTKVYWFGEDTAVFEGRLLLKDKLIGYGDEAGIIVKGGVFGTKSFATSGVMADKKGMFLGKVGGGFESTISSATKSATSAADQIRDDSTQRHKSTIVEKVYGEAMIGSDQVIEDLGFSFRDPPSGESQYKAEGIAFPEPRWQQFTRFGLASGGTGWSERPVIYQGQETFPWPGKAALKDESTFHRLAELSMFDGSKGMSKDRPGPYETPALSSWEKVPIDSTYKLNR